MFIYLIDSEMLTQVVVQIKSLKDLLNNYKVRSTPSTN